MNVSRTSQLALIFLLGFMISSCSNVKLVDKNKPRTEKTAKYKNRKGSKEAEKLIAEAKSYLGTPYRYGGTNKRGIDCSGLVYNSFGARGIEMPRVSRDQSKKGNKVSLKNVRPGDVLFFNTSGRGISHVGIVERVENNEIFFIHSSSSRGVIITSLNNSYWNPRFVVAKRILGS